MLRTNAWQMANIHDMFQVTPEMMMLVTVSLWLGAQALDFDYLVLNPSSAIYRLSDLREFSYTFCASMFLFAKWE